MKYEKKFLRQDLSSGLVVFLVALPLCLGIGLASTNVKEITGMPNVFAGLISGVIGGVVVGFISNSRIGVSGPAAGLITVITAAITTLGSFEGFLTAVLLSGIIQLLAGFLKLGIIGHYFPSSVIKGMLAAIGITLILKEIPHAIGYDKDFFGDEAFFQLDGHNTFSELLYAANAFHPGAIIIGLCSLLILILFDKVLTKRYSVFKFIPGALIVVVLGVLFNQLFSILSSGLYVDTKHLVEIPRATSAGEFFSFFNAPDFTYLSNPNTYIVAMTIALIGSVETLLSVEATDKLDPEKHLTPTNRELKAQGVGNIISGLIGGLPITQVIVRSSANVNAGAKTKYSAIFHGLLLLVCVITIPSVLNMIPLATLAAVLIMVGYKLASVSLFKSVYRTGLEQFLPFVLTIAGVLFSDLLKGIALGMVVALFFILRRNYHNNYVMEKASTPEGTVHTMVLSEEVTFLNKGSIVETLREFPMNGRLIIDGSRCRSIDHDIQEVIREFALHTAPDKKIELSTINIPNISIS